MPKSDLTYIALGGIGLGAIYLYLSSQQQQTYSSGGFQLPSLNLPSSLGLGNLGINTSGLTSGLSSLGTGISSVGEGLATFSKSATSTASAIGGIGTSVTKGINDATNSIKGAISGAGNTLVNVIPTGIGAGVGGALLSVPENIIGGLVKGIALNPATQGLTGLTQLATGQSISQIKQNLASATSTLSAMGGQEVLGSVATGLNNVVTGISNAVSNIFKNIPTLFGGK
jgi:hypothetical protein